MSNEYIQISAFLRPEQIEQLDEWARRKGIHGRQPLIRWAIDHYLAFLMSDGSTYRVEQYIDQSEPAEPINV
jgi:hypothetical protein